MDVSEQGGVTPELAYIKVCTHTADIVSSFADESPQVGSGTSAQPGSYSVCILFRPEVMHCVMEQEWFEGQRLIRHENGATELRFNVADLDGIDRWVLSWGVDAIALKPNELRLKVIETLQVILDKHPE